MIRGVGPGTAVNWSGDPSSVSFSPNLGEGHSLIAAVFDPDGNQWIGVYQGFLYPVPMALLADPHAKKIIYDATAVAAALGVSQPAAAPTIQAPLPITQPITHPAVSLASASIAKPSIPTWMIFAGLGALAFAFMPPARKSRGR